jgi:precorrin-8X/cobalt-precorrin-8 methylmutase
LGSTFREVWSTLQVRINDDNQNRSNRFQVANDLNQLINGGAITGPFWGRPVSIPANELPFLAATKPRDIPRDSLREFRVVEERLRNCGKRPFSAWQLFGNGSVGSQALLGMPQLHTLRYDQELCHHSIVWPFETEHWKIPLELRPLIVHAEFWPTAIPINKAFHPVKDAAQVMSFVAWAAKGDSDGSLMSYFNPLAPEDPDRELARKEGWILGFRGCA